MMLRVSLALLSAVSLPVLLLAQKAPPPEVDQALRARVTEFFDLHIAGNFRKAEPMVAEDTKNYYYSAAKHQLKSYKMGKIEYNDDFTKAHVDGIAVESKLMAGQVIDVALPMGTEWKIEDGKWCWTFDPNTLLQTPMSPKGGMVPRTQEGANTAQPPRPKDLSPASIQSAGQEILRGQLTAKLDKSEVTFAVDKASSEQVVFHNGSMQGQVSVEGPKVKGLTAQFDKAIVDAQGTATLKLHYDPSDKSGPPDAWTPKGTITLNVVVAPLNQTFPIAIKFDGGPGR